MSASLWKIDSELRGVLADIAMAQGEVTPEQEAQLDSLNIKREEKLKGYLRAIRLYELEEGRIQMEVDRITGHLNDCRKQKRKLEGILKGTLAPGEPCDDEESKLGVTWRRSEALNTDKCDIKKLPEQFIRYEEVYSPRKVELKKYIEEGNEVPGCFIEEKWHLKIT